MDYKEFIKSLRDESMFQRSRFSRGVIATELKSAADTIETLLAERDAAVEDLAGRPSPSTCKHGENCDYISVITGRPDCYSCDEWEWRGPQKGDRHGDLP